MAENDELLTPEEVAALLKVEKHFVLQLARKGELPALRLGTKTIRFIKSEVIGAMAEKAKG